MSSVYCTGLAEPGLELFSRVGTRQAVLNLWVANPLMGVA